MCFPAQSPGGVNVKVTSGVVLVLRSVPISPKPFQPHMTSAQAACAQAAPTPQKALGAPAEFSPDLLFPSNVGCRCC